MENQWHTYCKLLRSHRPGRIFFSPRIRNMTFENDSTFAHPPHAKLIGWLRTRPSTRIVYNTCKAIHGARGTDATEHLSWYLLRSFLRLYQMFAYNYATNDRLDEQTGDEKFSQLMLGRVAHVVWCMQNCSGEIPDWMRDGTFRDESKWISRQTTLFREKNFWFWTLEMILIDAIHKN